MENQVKVIVLNSHGIGHFVYLAQLPRLGETVRAKKWEFSEDAAKGTDVAVALGKLGVKTAFVCRVGADDAGKKGEQWLSEAGVDSTYYIQSPHVQTGVGITIMLEDGENSIIGSEKRETPTTEEDARNAIDAFPNAEYFVSGFEIDQRLSLEACKYAKSKGKITILNPSPIMEPITGKLNYIDYLFYNEIEGCQLLDIEDDCTDYGMMAKTIAEHYGVQVSAMTLGRNGCYVYGNGVDRYFPPFDMPRVATIGAGDGFMAAYTAGLVWGMDDATAAEWANRYAGVLVSRDGSIRSYPWLDEVEQYIIGLPIKNKLMEKELF